MDWSNKRKLLYGLSGVALSIGAVLFFFRDDFFPKPTCADNKKNGFEIGVDCGGVCALRCQSEVTPLSVVWARAIPTSTSTYDLVGIISNKNINNAPKSVAYTFTAYDPLGAVMFTESDTTAVLVEDDIPVMIQNVVSYKQPGTVTLTLSPASHYTAQEKSTSPSIKVLESTYEPGEKPRVYVTVKNMTLAPMYDLPIRVILFDQNQNAIGAGESVIQVLEREEEKKIVLTWKQPFTETVARIRVYPLVNVFGANY